MAKHDSNYSEDLFADTRMSFGEHLEDLRLHLWRGIAGFLVCLIISFFFGKAVLRFIAYPVQEQLEAFYDRRVTQVEEELKAENQRILQLNAPVEQKWSFKRSDLAEQLGFKAPGEGDWVDLTVKINPLEMALALNKAEREIGRKPYLSTLSVQEAFMAYFWVCVVCGLVLGSPWIFYQVWLFVAAGLYPHEKRYVHVYLPFSLGLFLAGVAICQFVVLPKAIQALLWFNEWLGLEPDVRFNEWLGFAIMMPLVFGISFQLPLVMMFLERIGIMTVEGYLSQWRIWLFMIHVFAAVITPSIDVISMEFLALPMFGLYLLGILLCRLNATARDQDLDVPDPEEPVGV